MSAKRTKKKAVHFPAWAEGLVIAGMLAMSVVEGMHDQTFFAVIFGVAGGCFGISLLSRMMGGDDDGRA